MSSAPQAVADLVERFARHADDYRRGAYGETEVRVEYIDPLFEALGWDVHNRAGYAEAYKDVVHEDAIKVGGATKAPDYCFRVGGTRKFFLEAKKPSVQIGGDVGPAYQLRRYAWSAKLPLSILSDFEELAVYDCRVRPKPTDKAATARVNFLQYTDYVPRWDEIASVFAKQAVLDGRFDKYLGGKRARGTAEVDAAFLKEIESWRDAMARNIALRNPGLSVRDLNFAVQRTIDRIIFLRICEDRGIEAYGGLQGLLSGQRVYPRLMDKFVAADDRYNSGLFHFRLERGRPEAPDELTPGLTIDDKVLKDIIRSLYHPHSPYEFSVLPADILGSVYEQFLGKVIHLTPGHRARVEEKPEVKKAGGVYYTPKYIVDYIVEHTVGRLLYAAEDAEDSQNSEGGKRAPKQPSGPVVPQPSAAAFRLTPRQAARLRILDPACGSGSFLIRAYRKLLDYHRDWYLADGAEKHRKQLYQGAGGQWYLTTDEKKRVLLNNIYGVDIDPQAVEVTKLNLLLCVLEHENQGTLRQLALIHQRALPDLAANIKCGNSLIGTDFYQGQQLDLFDEDTRYRINAFDWEVEFPAIFRSRNPGFDAVIGNPPYIRMEEFKELKPYLKARYECHAERSDLYAYFIEREHKLMRANGRFGMIVSNKFLRSKYGEPIRRFLARVAQVEQIVDFAGLPVFVGATIRTVILVTSARAGRRSAALYCPPVSPADFERIAGGSLSVREAVSAKSFSVSAASLGADGWSFAQPEVAGLLENLSRKTLRLKDYIRSAVCRGVVSGLTEAFVIGAETRSRILAENPGAGPIIKSYLDGRDVRRYRIVPKNLYLIYTYHGVDISKYPAVRDHLAPSRDRLKKRATKQEWYELQQPQQRYTEYFERPKIIFPDIATEPRFALDTEGFYFSNTTYFIPVGDLYLLGLLNSRLAFLYFSAKCAGLEGKGQNYLRFFGQYLEAFPVPDTEAGPPDCQRVQQKLKDCVRTMIALQDQVGRAKTPHDSELLKRQIAGKDREIDRLVYELYGLTEEEIRIAEEATQG